MGVRVSMRGRLAHGLRRLRRETSGAVAMVFALALPVCVLLIGTSIEYASALVQKQRLQSAVDAATLAAARELSLSDARRENVAAAVEAMVVGGMQANDSKAFNQPVLQTTVRSDPFEVEVSARQPRSPFFGTDFGLPISEISVNAVARIVGKPNICVLALEEAEIGAIWLVDKARMTGNNCSVFSNSTSGIGIAVRGSATLAAQTVCSAGGVDHAGNISPAPILDCPQFEDPLASRGEPAIGKCEYQKLSIDNQTVTLKPGVYCGGLRISGTSNVRLDPGLYIIADGLFHLDDTAQLSGDGVSFFLGAKALLLFGAHTTIDFTASKTGPLAGLLIFGSRQQPRIFTHIILSQNAHRLVGTIYLPRNSFVVDGDAKIGGESAYTAIVARRLVLLNGPHLVLNSNYDMTDVPVPAGIRGAGQPVSLVK